MSASFHPPVEEYLATIYEMDEEAVPTIQARLSERLAVSAASVSEMVRRLESEGYLTVDDRVLHLTRKGRRQAEAVVRKHRLAERLLTDVIGLPWEKAHIEAGRWEHVISDEVEERLIELLGHPDTCPHGNPIPGALPPQRTLKPLAASRPGDRVHLERVTESLEMDASVVTHLAQHGFIPGATATVQAKGPDGTFTLDVDGTTLAVGESLAEQLFVSSPASASPTR